MLSIAIATMDRWKFLEEILPPFLEHSGVKEVILCDENGRDAEAIRKSSFAQNPKLHVIVNEKQLGIYQNKRKAARLATGDWVAVLDSDNYFSEEWLDTICDWISRPGSEKTIFCSADFVNTNFNNFNTEFPCKQFSGMRITKESWNSLFTRQRWNFLLNDGNWVLPREAIACWPEKTQNLYAVDALFMIRECVKGGFDVYYIPGLRYIHTVHDGSSWLATERDSTRVLNTTDWRI